MSHSDDWLINTPSQDASLARSQITPSPQSFVSAQPLTPSLRPCCCMTLGESLNLLGPFKGEQAGPGEELHYMQMIHLSRHDRGAG